ncbi:MAG TPA: hypothetical protein VF765_16780 [Polyangiaceae bacterium]
MKPRTAAYVVVAWAVATAIACLVVHRTFALRVDEAHPRAIVATVWAGGAVVGRAVVAHEGDSDPGIAAALAEHPGATLAHERVVGEGPIVARPELAFMFSVVPGRDGIAATLDGRTVYVTPDELLARQAYDHGLSIAAVQLSIGLDVPTTLAMLAERLGVSARDVLDRAALSRIRVSRHSRPRSTLAPDSFDAASARRGALAAARYLARNTDSEGRFRYLVEAPTNRELPGYDWPRHAGATYFLAEAAAASDGDPDIAFAALRAAGYLRDHALVPCGLLRCIGDGAVVDVGSAALAILAFAEIARTGLDPAYAPLVRDLAAFLRSQQRADGELMHEYDRAAGRPIDVQRLYFSGEAALALSRAHALLGDPRDLEAARRALHHLVHGAWSFFGSRYYWGEEHWTCQAADDLWDRAPSEEALDFCLGWAAYNRKLMYGAADTALDADGAYGVGPVVTPRLTPAGSRSEATAATLDMARRAGRPREQLEALDGQLRRSLALLLRQQFALSPGLYPTYLLADPHAVDGAVPGSEVDWDLRIDYSQHAGNALLRAAGQAGPPTNVQGEQPGESLRTKSW